MTTLDAPALAFQLVWPMVFVLVALVVTRRLATDIRPIFINIVTGVANGAKTNYMAYGIAFLFGLSASLSAFVDVFKDLSHQAYATLSFHQYLVMWAKVLNPFIVAILAYAMKNDFKDGGIGGKPAAPVVSATASPFPLESTDTKPK